MESVDPLLSKDHLNIIIRHTKLDWFVIDITFSFYFKLDLFAQSALSAGVLCASVALGEAGVEMYDLVSSCSLVSELNIFEECNLI